MAVSGLPSTGYDHFFPTILHGLCSEYAEMSGDARSTVVENDAHGYDSPGGAWLALNPDLGHRLGWQLLPAGLFRWVDRTGALMAETQWWTDGLLDQSPPHFDDEVGEGWFVLVTQTALDQIRGILGNLTLTTLVERSSYRERIRESRQSIGRTTL